MPLTPISAKERIITIDIIRGFALLGIFLVNMPAYHSPDFLMQMYGIMPEYTGLDHILRIFFTLFIQTKFYTIFSFLFGLGFYIFMSRTDQKALPRNRLFIRRILVLLGFGFIHFILLWFGDILHAYAIAGFLLLFFYKRSNKTILIWAVFLLTIYHALMSLPFIIPESDLNKMKKYDQIAYSEQVDEYMRVYEHEDYINWVSYRWKAEIIPILENIPFTLPTVLGMFLLGLYAGRKELFKHDTPHLTFIKKVQIITIILSIPTVAYLVVLLLDGIDLGVYQEYAEFLLTSVSGITLSLFYISSLTLLLRKEKWQTALRPLGFAGQMALTNYLAQTVMTMGIIFGFNLYGDISLTVGTIMSLVIFSIQILFSTYWLKKYRFGPLEWIWRSLTYGKLQSLKRGEYQKDT